MTKELGDLRAQPRGGFLRLRFHCRCDLNFQGQQNKSQHGFIISFAQSYAVPSHERRQHMICVVRRFMLLEKLACHSTMAHGQVAAAQLRMEQAPIANGWTHIRGKPL
jgi:hypothetical protein